MLNVFPCVFLEEVGGPRGRLEPGTTNQKQQHARNSVPVLVLVQPFKFYGLVQVPAENDEILLVLPISAQNNLILSCH